VSRAPQGQRRTRPTAAAVLRDEAALARLAFDAARRAVTIHGDSFCHHTGRAVSVQRKASAIDLVTEVDRAAEKAILAVLRESDVAVVTEEGSGDALRGSPEAVFYVDPLDGTTNYANGHPFFCVSIALVVKGEPRVGVVWAQQLSVVWYGTRERAVRLDTARFEERPLAASRHRQIEAVLLGTGFPYDRRTSSDDNLAAHNALMKRAQGVMRCGSAAIDMCLVADGTYGGYWERKLKPWDLAAGAALVRAAGGRVTDPWGGTFRVESGDVVASNGLVHDELLGVLAPHLPRRAARARSK
jgi:myo-inositol-1(or 4)-monophosphatase